MVLLYRQEGRFYFYLRQEVFCMDAIFLRKTFSLIAKGLVEKEQLLQKQPARYPYSKALQHGINMFLAASHQIGGVQDIMQYADEAAFLKLFITKPVIEWFDEWDPKMIDCLNLKEEPFYNCGAAARQRTYPVRRHEPPASGRPGLGEQAEKRAGGTDPPLSPLQQEVSGRADGTSGNSLCL